MTQQDTEERKMVLHRSKLTI